MVRIILTNLARAGGVIRAMFGTSAMATPVPRIVMAPAAPANLSMFAPSPTATRSHRNVDLDTACPVCSGVKGPLGPFTHAGPRVRLAPSAMDHRESSRRSRFFDGCTRFGSPGIFG
jgi:hypothetical protein